MREFAQRQTIQDARPHLAPGRDSHRVGRRENDSWHAHNCGWSVKPSSTILTSRIRTELYLPHDDQSQVPKLVSLHFDQQTGSFGCASVEAGE